tara:strand:- start:34 stop:240 length:207 start_codon:yes stop_codon:yes gene_type:complete
LIEDAELDEVSVFVFVLVFVFVFDAGVELAAELWTGVGDPPPPPPQATKRLIVTSKKNNPFILISISH